MNNLESRYVRSGLLRSVITTITVISIATIVTVMLY